MANYTTVSRLSFEILPSQASKLPQGLLPGTRLFITNPPGKPVSFNRMASICSKLHTQGFQPVPHLCVRRMANASEFQDGLSLLATKNAVANVLLLAGSDENSQGSLENTHQLLSSNKFDFRPYGVKSVGLAGHPEGNTYAPHLSVSTLLTLLLEKIEHLRDQGISPYVMTQFCFNAESIVSFLREFRKKDAETPVYLGIPGVCTLSTLLKYASLCGVNVQALMNRTSDASKLLVYHPDDLLSPLNRLLGASAGGDGWLPGIDGLHVYPFGGLEKSVEFFQQQLNAA